MSLAQSILEYLAVDRKPYLFFATHYHELTKLSEKFPQIQNWHMSIRDDAGGIQFLYSLTTGPAEKSYGIHVAQLAKLPPSLIKRAQELLSEHEVKKNEVKKNEDKKHVQSNTSVASQAQLNLWDAAVSNVDPEWVEELKRLDVSKTTPLEALQKVSQWRQKLS